MRNIWRIFKTDMKHLFNNSISVIIVIGLVFLPSIFTWYNVIACWDAFGNTGNLTVAVANTDEGYESDLVPLEINVGDKVVSALRANDQLNWTFTTEEDAIDGAQSGRYYAAVVIPQSFSRDMMTFYSDEVEHANIIYYTNEKKNAIAPKITSKAKTAVQEQINTTILEKVADALTTAGSVFKAMGLDGQDIADGLLEKLSSAQRDMDQMAQVFRSLQDVMDGADSLLAASAITITDAQGTMDDASAAAGSTVRLIDSGLVTANDQLAGAVVVADLHTAQRRRLFAADGEGIPVKVQHGGHAAVNALCSFGHGFAAVSGQLDGLFRGEHPGCFQRGIFAEGKPGGVCGLYALFGQHCGHAAGKGHHAGLGVLGLPQNAVRVLEADAVQVKIQHGAVECGPEGGRCFVKFFAHAGVLCPLTGI